MDLLDKLYHRLVDAVDTASTDAYRAGMTVADVYQRLIPYRMVRGQVGVIELAEYEHALLRLLSGERRYVEVGDPTVKLEIQRELASLNPILGIYRDYSGAKLELVRGGEGNGGEGAEGAVGRVADEAPARPGRSKETSGAVASGSDLPPEIPPLAADATRVRLRRPTEPSVPGIPDRPGGNDVSLGARDASAPESDPIEGGPSGSEAAAPGRPSAAPGLRQPASAIVSPAIDQCSDCGRSLPGVADLLFCPFCGAAQAPRPCAHCGGEMERGWSFCPRCGTARGAPAPSD